MKRVAVVLCGSGFKDGSEIRESVGVLWALSVHGAQVECFAPNAPQKDVVNCLTGEPCPGESRNMLVEAARIARGDVKPLTELNMSQFDALILPGGFGAAKNLCTFAFEGSRGKVIPELKIACEKAHVSGKPIGAVCIAPSIVAMALSGRGLELTLGAPGPAAQEIEKLGHKHIVCQARDICLDRKNKVVSTPAYMYDHAPLSEVFMGIESLVKKVLEIA
jgi:enhancing lycopene biosynthesis protein 2